MPENANVIIKNGTSDFNYSIPSFYAGLFTFNPFGIMPENYNMIIENGASDFNYSMYAFYIITPLKLLAQNPERVKFE